MANRSEKYRPIVKLLVVTFGLRRPGEIVKRLGWVETTRLDRWSMDILYP